MGVMGHSGRPPSQRDRTLPYTYEGWVDILDGRGLEPVCDHYFADTLCGLIEYLADEGVAPDRVKLYCLFRQKRARLDNSLLVGADGRWLQRPELCRALEEHYAHSHDDCYQGHVEKARCSFEDRDRRGAGPTW